MSSWTSSGATSLRVHASCQVGLDGATTPSPWSARFLDFAESRDRNHLAKDGIAASDALSRSCFRYEGVGQSCGRWPSNEAVMDVVMGDDVVHSEVSQRCCNGEAKLIRNTQR